MDAWLKYRQVWGVRGTDLCPAGRKRPAREEEGGRHPIEELWDAPKRGGKGWSSAASWEDPLHGIAGWVGGAPGKRETCWIEQENHRRIT